LYDLIRKEFSHFSAKAGELLGPPPLCNLTRYELGRILGVHIIALAEMVEA